MTNMIEFSQWVTVIYHATVLRDDAIQMLTSTGVPAVDANALTDEELGAQLAAIANSADPKGVYETLTDASGDWEDIADVGDWTAKVVQR